jgi:hypothetical protein
MDIGVMVLGASAFLAEVDILAPTAVHQFGLFPDGAANRADLEHFGDHVA